MNIKYESNPLVVLEQNCTMLRDSGFSESVIDDFIIESISQLEEEFKQIELNEGFSDALRKITNTFSGGVDVITDSIREKLTDFILDKMGFADSWVKTILVKFIGNLTYKEMLAMFRGQRNCDGILPKSAQTAAEVVVSRIVSNKLGLFTDPKMPKEPSVAKAAATAAADEAVPVPGVDTDTIGFIMRTMVINAISGSDLQSPLAKALRPNMKVVCDFLEQAMVEARKYAKHLGLAEVLSDINKKELQLQPVKENFQKRMKVRLKKSMKTILDGGRKDLVKYGKPWSQGRQKYSNAFGAKETSTVANIQGPAVKDEQ